MSALPYAKLGWSTESQRTRTNGPSGLALKVNAWGLFSETFSDFQEVMEDRFNGSGPGPVPTWHGSGGPSR